MFEAYELEDCVPNPGARFFKLGPDLPCRTYNFMNPTVDMDNLSKRWTKAARESGLVVCLQGREEAGKTQVALEYARRRAEEFTSVFWISAENKHSIELGFHGIGRRLLEHYSFIISSELSNLSKQDARSNAAEMLGLRDVAKGTDIAIDFPSFQDCHIVSEAVRDWFNRADNSKWLLILDGMDGPDLTECLSLMPTERQNGLILITRRETWSPSQNLRTRVVFEHISLAPPVNPNDRPISPEYVFSSVDFLVQDEGFQMRRDKLSGTEHTLLACCSLFPGEFIPIQFFSVNYQTLHMLDAEYTGKTTPEIQTMFTNYCIT